MRSLLTFLICLFAFISRHDAQLINDVKGSIVNADTKQPLKGVRIVIDNTSMVQFSNAKGFFIIKDIPLGSHTLVITKDAYEIKRFTIIVEKDKSIDLGTIPLIFDFSGFDENSGFISLTEDDLINDNGQAENIAGILQSSRDIFQNKAAFDFGQAFFRVRGYDSQNAQVLLNGLSMNKLFNGRPQWNNWGGLNDITRNQELTSTLAPSNYSFGDVLGVTNISTRVSKYRPGIRISNSFSNRTYIGRGMVTYSSGYNM